MKGATGGAEPTRIHLGVSVLRALATMPWYFLSRARLKEITWLQVPQRDSGEEPVPRLCLAPTAWQAVLAIGGFGVEGRGFETATSACQARMPRTTWPYTSVKRKSRPAWR
jgi:hypothetical protein